MPQPLSSRPNARAGLLFEVSPVAEEAAGPCKEIPLEWDTGPPAYVPASMGISSVAEESHLTSPGCFLVCATLPVAPESFSLFVTCETGQARAATVWAGQDAVPSSHRVLSSGGSNETTGHRSDGQPRFMPTSAKGCQVRITPVSRRLPGPLLCTRRACSQAQ